jgi:choice-of-anchor A domain-containing protein
VLDFDALKDQFERLSDALKALPATGIYVEQYGGLYFTGTNNPDLEVFEIPAGKYFTSTSYRSMK